MLREEDFEQYAVNRASAGVALVVYNQRHETTDTNHFESAGHGR
jgi:hypothetical protein